MKKIIIVTIIIILGVLCLKGQYPKIELLHNDISNFPEITTAFKLFDSNGNEIRSNNLTTTDFIIEEIEKSNAIPRQIINIECPQADQTTLSVILVVDISTSMINNKIGNLTRLEILKEVLMDFVKNFDPKRTEIAITLFAGDAIGHPTDYNNRPFQPFTTDREELIESVKSINDCYAGTNWNAAFLYKNGKPDKQDLSALYYCQDTVRKYKPVIIFLTDGDHNAKGPILPFDLSNIQQIAEERNASIYCIQISDIPFAEEQNRINFMELARIGKPLTDGTDNFWLEVSNSESLAGIYQGILEEAHTLGDPPPCSITWVTGCEGGSATITVPNHGNVSAITSYNFDDSKVPQLRIVPPNLSFKDISVGSSQEQELTLTAINGNVVISDVSFLENIRADGRFFISNWGSQSPLPIFLEKNQSYKIVLNYTPSDELYSHCVMQFEGTSCNSATISMTGESEPIVEQLDFGKVFYGKQKDSIFTKVLCNTTGKKLKITDIRIEGYDASNFMFTKLILPVNLDTGQCLELAIRCRPINNMQGVKQAKLAITSDYNINNKIEGIITCNVISSGTAPVVQRMDFGNIQIGTESDSVFTQVFCNSASYTIKIYELSIDGDDKDDFTVIEWGTDSTLSPGECISITLKCSPINQVVGVRIARLIIKTDFEGLTVFEGVIACNVIDGTSVYDNNSRQNIFELYPNPATNQVSIVLNENYGNSLGNLENSKITIYNCLGMEIKTIKLNEIDEINKFIINLEGLQSGIYFVELKTNSLNEIIPLSIIR